MSWLQFNKASFGLQSFVASILLCLLGVLSLGGIVLASNVSGANYLTTLSISNTGTEANNVWATFNLSTAEMISGGLSNDNATDCAIRTYTGDDVAFMPSVNSTYPWIMQVPSIGANSQLNQYLYSDNATGGKIRYFPDTAGMTTSDNGSLEISDNGSIEIKGFIDTENGLDKYIIEKSGAITVKVSDTMSGNITAYLFGNATSISQTTNTNFDNVYGGRRSGQRLDSFSGRITSVSFYMAKISEPEGIGYARVRSESDDSIIGTLGSVDVTTLGAAAWKSFSSSAVLVPTSRSVRISFEFGDGDAANYIGVYRDPNNTITGSMTYYNGSTWTDTGTSDRSINLSYSPVLGLVTATEVDSREHTLKLDTMKECDIVGMKQVIIGGTSNPLSATSEYSPLSGGYNWGLDISDKCQVVSTSGNFTSFSVELSEAPGAGSSYTFQLKNMTKGTNLPVTISGTNTTSSNSSTLAVTPGDVITIYNIDTGTPTTPYARWSVSFNSVNPNDSLILGNVIPNYLATSYNPISNGNGASRASNETWVYQIIPTSGKIKNLYLALFAARETAPNGYRYTLCKNGASTNLTTSIIGNSVTGNNTVNEVAVVAGDYVDLMIEPIGNPQPNASEVWYGFTFEADIKGESLILGVVNDTPSTADTEYNYLTTTSWSSTWGATENQRYQGGQSMVLKKLYVKLSSAPGAEKSYLIGTRVNGSTKLSTTISNSATTGNDLVNTWNVGDFDDLNMISTPTGTPTATMVYWGLVCYIKPSPYLLLSVDGTLQDAAVLLSGMSNTSSNWISFQNGAMPYVEYQRISVNGTPRQYIKWAYNTIFPDLSGNGNSATPTFRKTSSDADVTVTITSQRPTGTQGQPTTVTPGGWTMISSAPVEPTGLYTEGGTGYPGGPEIEDFTDTIRTPYESIAFPLAIGSAVLLGLIAFAATSKAKIGVKGSLLIQGIVTMAVLIYWYAGVSVIPGWILIPFGAWIIVLLLWRNPFSTPIG